MTIVVILYDLHTLEFAVIWCFKILVNPCIHEYSSYMIIIVLSQLYSLRMCGKTKCIYYS